MRRSSARTAAASAAAVVLLLVAGCGGGGGSVSGNGYTFTLPSHWTKISAPAGMLAAYKRDAHTGLVTIRRAPGSPIITRAFLHSLNRKFHRELPGYVPLQAKIIDTKAGGVFLLTYTQRKTGRLTNIALVPVKGKNYSFVIDAVVTPTSKPASVDVAAIINSFKPS